MEQSGEIDVTMNSQGELCISSTMYLTPSVKEKGKINRYLESGIEGSEELWIGKPGLPVKLRKMGGVNWAVYCIAYVYV